MPDSFNNARPYFDVTFPTSGDGFTIHGFRNALAGLGFMDMIPLQPRAHSPGDMRVMVRGQDASTFYNPVYFGNADQRIPFSSGDTAVLSAPVSNPRIDIVYITPSGDIKVQTGTEAASPTLPALAPSGDSRFPVCAIWHKVGETKIVNFEDKDSNSGDGYIYKDLRPWMRTAGAGATSLTATSPLSPTGDNAVGTGGTAARHDHTHQGVHTIKKPGSGDIFGDVELAGEPLSQAGNRITLNVATQAQMEAFATDNAVVTPRNFNFHPGALKAACKFNGTGTPALIGTAYNIGASIADNGAGDYTLSFIKPFATADYFPTGNAEETGTAVVAVTFISGGFAAGTLRVQTQAGDNTNVDPAVITVKVHGDQ